MHITQMATKTISVKDAAYERLRAARRYSGESFSEVVMRATWPEDTITARGLVELRRASRPIFDLDTLDRVDEVKRTDRAPEDKWAGR